MKITKKEIATTNRNIFNNVRYGFEEIEEITCTKKEFLEILKEKKFRIVNIKRTPQSEFLFDTCEEWRTYGAKWAVLNTEIYNFGEKENIRFEESLDKNDRLNDIMIIE